LITSIILKGLDNNNFSFSAFYLRRAKRLLPALYSTLLFTTLLCLLVLTKQQWLEYLNQLIGSLTFTANMVLPAQTGYFESASDGKPLLHIWSLSLEEQYYFLLPITLYLLPKKYRLIGISLLTALSLYFCFSWVYSENQYAPFLWRIADSTKSEWAFYLLFTRAWELLAGSLCAWIMLYKPNLNTPKSFKLLALLVIGFSCFTSINNEHPSIESVIVVLSTMTILIGSKNWLPNYYVIHVVEKIGDWSYSIYLVHWPLFAFAYLSYVGDVPTGVNITLVFFSVFLGYMQFKYVETSFRIGKFKNLFSSWKVTLSATAIFLIIPITLANSSSNVEDAFSHIRRTNYGLGKACNNSFDEGGKLKSSCLLGKKPKIVVWGDSYAMHLVPGLIIKNNELAQITKSVCAPIIGIAPIKGKYDSVWASSCLQFNDNALNYIRNTPSITHAVLSSSLEAYVNFSDSEYLTKQSTIKANYDLLTLSFKNTILELIKLNIIPVVISPPPKAGFNIGECLERQHGRALLLRENCKINYLKYQQHQKLVNETLKEIEKVTNVIWLKDYLCDAKYCKVYTEGTFIYRDDGHLSIDGSVKSLGNLNIKELY